MEILTFQRALVDPGLKIFACFNFLKSLSFFSQIYNVFILVLGGVALMWTQFRLLRALIDLGSIEISVVKCLHYGTFSTRFCEYEAKSNHHEPENSALKPKKRFRNASLTVF